MGMLSEVMASVNNYFFTDSYHFGTFKIENGSFEFPYLVDGQYFAIQGSTFNDGIHLYGDSSLSDETFTGYISPMAVPKDFLALVEEIEAWMEQYGDKAQNPYTSESFDGYSYSKGSDADVSWQSAFRKRLARWRRL